MRKLLPNFFIFIFLLFQFFFFLTPAFAQESSQSAVNETVNQVSAQAVNDVDDALPEEGTWVRDADVTFVGKAGARSGEFLDWTLQSYSWSSVQPGTQNPLAQFWITIRNIVYAFFALLVLITAFVLIVSRGRNITFMKFVPRFAIIVLLVTFSFAIVQFLYQIVDVVQGFFLTNPDYGKAANATRYISQVNLLNIAFGYKDFVGYRLFGPEYDESVFVSLLLVKLTAVTYYAMAGVLLVRKIILWFFIIISPIFPLLLLYSPIRNTGKIWVGEFFRWLLYAPIFSIFLSGLVHVWRAYIPLQFNFKVDEVIYPTGTSILLGGPHQVLSLTNSVNNKETFALYIVCLLMLWVVIILPFLLLQIFLDYFHSLSLNENNFLRQFASNRLLPFAKTAGTPPPPPPLPSSHQPSGMARTIPFAGKISIPNLRAEDISQQTATLRSIQSEISKLTNLTIPTMRDIARFEASSISKDIRQHGELAKYHETLERIGNPNRISAPIERQKYLGIKNKLIQEGQKGNSAANSVLTAANNLSGTSVIDQRSENEKITKILSEISNPQAANIQNKAKITGIKNMLEQASKTGDPLATSIMVAMQKGQVDEGLKEKIKEAKEKGNELASSIWQQAELAELKDISKSPFPVINRVQSVSLDDYEAVKKMWVENYQNLEPPRQMARKEWVKGDVEKINETVTLLSSNDPQNIKKGMETVGNILPFLLIGGFSQTEVMAYLKAKLEAAKAVLSDIGKKEEEEETKVERTTKKHQEEKTMSEERELKN